MSSSEVIMNSKSTRLNCSSLTSSRKAVTASFYMINEQGQEVKITPKMIDGAYAALRQCLQFPSVVGR
jgi:hypothetical protein